MSLDPEPTVRRPATYRPLPLEASTPLLDLTDPTPVDARQGVRGMLGGSPVASESLDGLVGAVSEVVTNASLHGRPPVRLRGWCVDGGCVVTVTDRGQGPDDPEVGIRPVERRPGEGGFGLWLAHQMCEVTMGQHPDGFTVRLEPRP